MARLLQSALQGGYVSSVQPIPAVSLFLVVMAVFSVFSVVNILCGSHGEDKKYKREKKNTVRLGDKRGAAPVVSELASKLSSKALLMTKMISWRKVQDEGIKEGEGLVPADDDDDEEGAVWKKTIMMGERCRPLEFSGRILYDEHGNPIPTMPPPAS